METTMKVHVISEGEFSDYHIVAILAVQSSKDIESLRREFEEKEHSHAGERPAQGDGDEAWEAWHNRRREAWGARTEEDGFVKWLKEVHGYAEYEFDDTNI